MVVVVVGFIKRNMVLAGSLLNSEMYGAGLNLSNLGFFRLKNMGLHGLQKKYNIYK